MIFAQSGRLILRKAKESDVEALLPSWSDPDMTRYMGRKDDARAFLAQLVADMQVKSPGEAEPGGPWYQFIVERREDGVVVGDLGAGFGVPGDHQVEIGYRILPAHQRRGYAREAVTALIDYLVERHNVHRIVGLAAALNTPSVMLLRSLGFRLEGKFKESFLCDGTWIDDDYFAILGREWRERRAEMRNELPSPNH